jgi:D-glycero-alpha-D-manno-heptose-7-phosphate kinase
MKLIVKARAPSRVDFAGGTLDIPSFARNEGGVTLNCAVAKYGHVKIYGKNVDSTIINSLDYNCKVSIKSKRIVYDGKLDLLKAALKRANFFENVEIVTKHDMPPHSRLGTSSSIGVAFLAAIAQFRNEKINKIKIADLATELETEELKMRNGPQDQYASALGGINFLKFNGKSVKVKKVKVKQDIISKLEKNLLLCYVGQAQVSGDMNGRIVGKYLRGNEKITNALRNIKEITVDMQKQLIKGNTEEFAYLLNEERLNREKLDEDIASGLKKFINVGLKNGAVAAKILGAGGGGTILFYAADNQLSKLTNVLRNINGRVYNFKFDFEGVKTWRV